MANINSITAVGSLVQGNVLVETAFPTVSGGAVRQTFGVPTVPSYTGQAVKKIAWRVSALVTGGTTTNYTMAVRFNSGGNTNLTTFTSDTSIATTAATAVNSATRAMMLEGFLLWDATSQRANGAFSILTDVVGGSPTYTAYTINSAAITGVTAITGLQFLVTGIFSATNANNTATIVEAVMDVT